METYKFFVGVDVSKATLDLVLRDSNEVISHQCIPNTKQGINKCFKEWEKKKNISLGNVLVCLENTGRYMNILLKACVSLGYDAWVENALSIKRSMGLQRGKNDKVDASRIAEYALRHSDKAILYKPSGKSVGKLKVLQSAREQLVSTRKRLAVELKESKGFDEAELYKLKHKSYKRTLLALEKDISSIEIQIDSILDEDEELSKLMKILESVPGIGRVTSTAFIIQTDGFKKFPNAKKFACYCGTAPFEYSSGSSIRGKTKVSNYANKSMKSLLFLCARSVIRVKGELKEYYERKLAEGKQKMSALNAVQNKLIHRIFALVRDGRLYEKNYIHSLA